MKTCNACNQKKPLTEFYSKTAQCIPCKKAKDMGRRRHREDRTGLSMTDDEALDAFCHTPGIHQFVQAFVAGVRFAEHHHGIKGGQHG